MTRTGLIQCLEFTKRSYERENNAAAQDLFSAAEAGHSIAAVAWL